MGIAESPFEYNTLILTHIGEQMLEFTKKEQFKFVDTIHTSLINNDLKGLMSTFMTMSEFSSFFATLKIDKDIKEERKSSRAAAKKLSRFFRALST